MSPVMQRAKPARTRAPSFAPRSLVGAGLLGLLGLTLASTSTGCVRGRAAREIQVTQAQADQYLRDAVRQSNEGVVLEPSQQGLDQIERVRLNEIAQQLRGPAAICFLERAIETMEPGEVEGEQGWLHVPEGQAKIRARVAVDGEVMSTEVLESGFTDEHMNECLSEVVAKQRFVESRDSFAYFIDVYYWVSLGFFAEARSASFAELLRREQTTAGVKAKACLIGRVPPGEYAISGLNLFDRDGRTVVNRIERGDLPQDVSTCVAAALKTIHIHPEPEAFVRPAAPAITFSVGDDGTVAVADERWLELIELEERAARDKRRAELLEQPIGDDADEDDADAFVDRGEPAPPASVVPNLDPDPDRAQTPPEPPPPDADPAKPGTKLDLSPRRRGH